MPYKQTAEFSGVQLDYKIEPDSSRIIAAFRQDIMGLDFENDEYTYLTLDDGVNHEIVKVVGWHSQGVAVLRGQLGTTPQMFAAGACLSSKPTYAMWKEGLESDLQEMVKDAVNDVIKQIGCGEAVIEIEDCCE